MFAGHVSQGMNVVVKIVQTCVTVVMTFLFWHLEDRFGELKPATIVSLLLYNSYYNIYFSDCGNRGCDLLKETLCKAEPTISKYPCIDDFELIRESCGIMTSSFEAFEIEGLNSSILDSMSSDCEKLATLSKDTFWITASEPPESLLEFFALEIFRYHTRNVATLDMSNCGAEWWVQTKRAIETIAGKTASVENPPLDEQEGEQQNHDGGIDLHYDKDECLASTFSVGIFPPLSTVTYLSDTPNAMPTLIFDATASSPVGMPIQKYFQSHPRQGKHIAFDGRLLHGAPLAFDPAAIPAADSVNDESFDVAASLQPPTRVTFLVNIWLGHHPQNVSPLPDHIREALLPSPSSHVDSTHDSVSPESGSPQPEHPGCRLMVATGPNIDSISFNDTSATIFGFGEVRTTSSSGSITSTTAISLASPSSPSTCNHLLRPTSNAAVAMHEDRTSTTNAITNASTIKPPIEPESDKTASITLSFRPRTDDTTNITVTTKDVEKDEDGEWDVLPFVSDKSAWGKGEDEAGLVLSMWRPNLTSKRFRLQPINGKIKADGATKRSSVSGWRKGGAGVGGGEQGGVGSTIAVTYASPACSARLEYEIDEEGDGSGGSSDDEEITKEGEDVVVEGRTLKDSLSAHGDEINEAVATTCEKIGKLDVVEG